MADDLRKQIEAVNSKMMEAFQARDYKLMASMYTQDCHILPPGSPAVGGRQGVEKVFSEEGKNAARVVLNVEEVRGMGNDYCFERHNFATLGADGQTVDKGKSIVIWRFEEGTWRAYIDIFNVDHHCHSQ